MPRIVVSIILASLVNGYGSMPSSESDEMLGLASNVGRESSKSDPAVLLVTFTIHRDGKFVLRSLREMQEGRADHGSNEGEYSVSLFDQEDGVIERLGFSLDFDKIWSHKPLNAAPVAFMLAYPPNAARVEIRRGETILGSFDTRATSLRKLIEAIPDRGFAKNAKQRRDALLSKVDAFEKLLATREHSNARNKLTSDIRKHVEMWTLDFDQGLLSESTRSDILAQIDRIDARLAHHEIDPDTFQAILTLRKARPDPPTLLVAGFVDRSDKIVASRWHVFETGGKIDSLDGGPYSVVTMSADGRVIESTAFSLGFGLIFDGVTSTDTTVVQTDTSSFGFLIHYPEETALVQIRKGDRILLEVDPLSKSLRDAILAIPDHAYDRTPRQRRQALLQKVDAFEKMIGNKDRHGALQKLDVDLRDKVEKWVAPYSGTLDQLSKEKVLGVIDHTATRLRAQGEPAR